MAFRDKNELLTKLENLKIILAESNLQLQKEVVPSITTIINNAILEGYVGALKWTTGEPDSFDQIVGKKVPLTNVNISKLN